MYRVYLKALHDAGVPLTRIANALRQDAETWTNKKAVKAFVESFDPVELDPLVLATITMDALCAGMDVGRLEVIFPANVLEVTCGIWANQSERLFETPDYEMLLRFVLAHASTSSTQGLVNVLLGHDAPSLQLKLEVMREEAAAGRSGWMTQLKALLTEATGSLWLEAALLAIKHEAGASLILWVSLSVLWLSILNSATL